MNGCFFIEEKPLKVTLIYICVSAGENTQMFSQRFIDTWLAFPPGHSCNLIVCHNGKMPPDRVAKLFDEFAYKFTWGLISYFRRTNDDGRDISAYQEIASSIASDADMIVCMGESVYFHRQGWLARIVEAWQAHGPGMYGVFANHHPNAHLGTTFFAVPPLFLSSYPSVTNHEQRYGFEHGKHALWRRVVAAGFPSLMVTWDGIWEPGKWREPKNCYWSGDQSNCLVWANHTDRYANQADANTKENWKAAANSPFK